MMLDLLVLLFLATAFLKIKVIVPSRTFNEEYLSVKTCNSYRGFFALVVLLHHISQRTSGGALLSDFTRVGYLAVAVFFFLSGYGLQKKNLTDSSYHKGFLSKRVLSIFIPYVIMSFIYWCAYALLGDVRTPSVIFYNFIKNGDPIVWFSWYVVNILIFYIVYYVLMKIFKQNRPGMILGGVFYYIIYALLCRKLSFGQWWYQTSLLPVLGIFLASYEKHILEFAKKYYLLLFSACWLLFILLARFKWQILENISGSFSNLFLTIILAVLFVTGVVLSSLKLGFGNKILDFLGKISFEIYMTQGLIMFLLRNAHFRIENDFLWSFLVILISIIASYFLNKFFTHILKKKDKA